MNTRLTISNTVAAVALAAGLVIAAPAAAKVSILQVQSPALVQGATYAWAPISGVAVGAPAPAIVNEITAGNLKAATETVLASKGYRQVQDPAQADLIVFYGVMTTSHLDAELDREGPCVPFCHAGGNYDLKTSQKTRGTLVLDLIERRSGRLVYRATSEKDIGARDASPQRLAAVLKQMTRSLPAR